MQKKSKSLVSSLEFRNNSVKITRLVASTEMCTFLARAVQQVHDTSQRTVAGREPEFRSKKYLYVSLLSVDLLYLELGVT
jgi:hypothetical protein